jgi:hypothetical protein
MIIHCLFVQRVCRYPGEYAPELFGAIDDIGNGEDPDYLNVEEESAKADSDIKFSRRMTIEVSDKEFDRIFFGEESLKGDIHA